MQEIARVVLPIALDKEFDYHFPCDLKVKIGARVVVDFRGRKRVGLVVGLGNTSQIKGLKSITDLLDAHPCLNQEHFQFAKELSNIYPYPMSQFLFMMIPPYLKKIRKLDLQETNILAQKEEARRVCDDSATFIKAASFSQRYFKWRDLVKEKLKEGSVLICFPQLSYLHLAKEILEKDFSGQITVIHSQENEKELFLNWKKTRTRALILGTRVSAFYYPLDLKLIVVEEENSPYYFQEEKPFYHILDVVLTLSAIKKISLVLAGDFPSLAAYKYIGQNQFILKDTAQIESDIKIINSAHFFRKKFTNPIFNELLRKAIQENKQAVILWNKKGFARVISCSACGHVLKCEHCSSFLQLALKAEEGVCPYCQKPKAVPKICDKCNNGYFKSSGYGIERVGTVLKGIFPEVKIDNWQNRSPASQIILSTSKILSSLYESETFDVGFILDADSFLMRQDYNATFDTFLYLKKLVSFFKDSLYVFTSNIDYYLFKCLNEQWENFYKQELKFRKEVNLPPFGLIAQITLRAKNKNKLLEKANDLYNRLEKRGQEVYGPFEEYPFKLRDKFRYSLIIKGQSTPECRKIIKEEVLETRASHVQLAASLR
jgi:primosomal protein N' (replication factor Y)